MSTTVTERPLYIAIQYIYYVMITNILFIAANILLVAAFIFVEIRIENILLFYAALLPMGPALAALHATMGKAIREQDLKPVKDFFSYYRKNFAVSSKYWLIHLTAVTILIIDIHYANIYFSALSPIFLFLIVILLFMMLYAFPILTRFEVKIKNLLMVSIYSIFRFYKTTLLHLSTLLSLGIIYYFAPGIVWWFCMSAAVFFIMLNMNKPLKVLETQMSENVREQHEKV
ncbi:DUF624 domain-containing protein [Gracilibacillus alcaliphilus]|uniref:DUF624 domain-containing protein n=1 Tax=Gracilibacillus alcaliphilus TaxID=1401441 RepID=UPI001956410E|nr:DUF624 domain-containing protein [Gracilibacillus alcaliphilus]MBM7676427.1 putative membrane protein YesL [Gracilibacillus alcaliphilus]